MAFYRSLSTSHSQLSASRLPIDCTSLDLVFASSTHLPPTTPLQLDSKPCPPTTPLPAPKWLIFPPYPATRHLRNLPPTPLARPSPRHRYLLSLRTLPPNRCGERRRPSFRKGQSCGEPRTASRALQRKKPPSGTATPPLPTRSSPSGAARGLRKALVFGETV